MIMKVKEPHQREWEMLRERQILFTCLHLAAAPAQTKGLLASGCIAMLTRPLPTPRAVCRCSHR